MATACKKQLYSFPYYNYIYAVRWIISYRISTARGQGLQFGETIQLIFFSTQIKQSGILI